MNRLSRRNFIGTTTTAVAAALIDGPIVAAEPETLFGSQLYGWGQYYGRDGKRLEDHLDTVFTALRDAGYHYAEGNVDVAHPEENAAFADRLRRHGLRPISLYTGGTFHTDIAGQTVDNLVRAGEFCAKAGFSVIVCNADPIGRDKTDPELAIQARAMSRLGAELKKRGIRLGLHQHTPELRNKAHEFHQIFALTEAGTVDFCIDTHWLYRGGVLPMDALQRYGNRVVSWHLRQSRNGIWWEDLDSGDIDYATIAAFAHKQKLPRRFSVELALESGTKLTRNVVENHRRSLDYARKIFTA